MIEKILLSIVAVMSIYLSILDGYCFLFEAKESEVKIIWDIE